MFCYADKVMIHDEDLVDLRQIFVHFFGLLWLLSKGLLSEVIMLNVLTNFSWSLFHVQNSQQVLFIFILYSKGVNWSHVEAINL